MFVACSSSSGAVQVCIFADLSLYLAPIRLRSLAFGKTLVTVRYRQGLPRGKARTSLHGVLPQDAPGLNSGTVACLALIP